MAATKLIIEIPEAHVNQVIAALCKGSELEPTGANAKKVVATMIRELVHRQIVEAIGQAANTKRREEEETTPEIEIL